MLDYAARNAILPNLTGFAMSLGFVVSGAILVEYVFNYPGVGFMLLQAVENEDYPLMQALFLLITSRCCSRSWSPTWRPRCSTRAPGRRADMAVQATAVHDPAAAEQPALGRSAARCGRNRKATAGTVLLVIFIRPRAVPRPDRARRPERGDLRPAPGPVVRTTCSAPPPTGRTSSRSWSGAPASRARSPSSSGWPPPRSRCSSASPPPISAASPDGSLSLVTDVFLVIPMFPL